MNALQRWREERLMSMRELAQKANVSHTTIYRIEKGIHKGTPWVLRRLAKALDVPFEEFAEVEDTTLAERGRKGGAARWAEKPTEEPSQRAA